MSLGVAVCFPYRENADLNGIGKVKICIEKADAIFGKGNNEFRRDNGKG